MFHGRLLHEAVLLKVFSQQGLYALAKHRIVRASAMQISSTLFCRALFDCREKDVLFPTTVRCLSLTHKVPCHLQWRNRSAKHANKERAFLTVLRRRARVLLAEPTLNRLL